MFLYIGSCLLTMDSNKQVAHTNLTVSHVDGEQVLQMLAVVAPCVDKQTNDAEKVTLTHVSHPGSKRAMTRDCETSTESCCRDDVTSDYEL